MVKNSSLSLPEAEIAAGAEETWFSALHFRSDNDASLQPKIRLTLYLKVCTVAEIQFEN